jgi:hypothetical protein
MEVKDGMGKTPSYSLFSYALRSAHTKCACAAAPQKKQITTDSRKLAPEILNISLGFPQAQVVRFLTFSGNSTLQTLG